MARDNNEAPIGPALGRPPAAQEPVAVLAAADGGTTSGVAADATVPSYTAKASAWEKRFGRWISRQPIARLIGATLLRRILVTNMLGLLGLLLAMLYFSLHHGWLIDAKVDVVKTVSRITAEAIAYRAVNDRAVFDANRLPEKSPAKVQRDDAFAALELPIDPSQAALVLKKLVRPTNLKARVYSQTGTLILDSELLFSNSDPAPNPLATGSEEAPRLKNFWTRFHYWLINKELKVYRELGTANGFLYPEVKMAAEQGVETPILLLDRNGQQIVSMAEPIKRGSKVLGVLFVSTQSGEIDDILWDERWLILQIAGIALLVAIVSSLLLARTVADPMKRLAKAANNVSQNIQARRELPDFSDRRDEVGKMGNAFTAMTAALFRRIEASEKFAADVAHELKNPLAAARSTAEALNYARTEDQRAELVQEIQTELKRLNRLINDVSSASRLDAELARQEMQPVNIKTVLDGVSGIFADMLADDTRNIALKLEPVTAETAYTVRGNDGRLAQVFTNLVDNALSFSPEGGMVTLLGRRSGDHVEVIVEDEGPGIPPDRIEAIFERFYSDRPATDSRRGKNSGLGLSISREIVLSHGGEIKAENRLSHDGKTIGARFIVRLPAVADAPGGMLGRRG